MTSKKKLYNKKRVEVPQVQSAISKRMPHWYYRAILLSDRPPPVIIPLSNEMRTMADLPEDIQRRIQKKVREVERLMWVGIARPRRSRRSRR
jgi:hypothetical protein